MKAILDLTVYDRRQTKVKDNKYDIKDLQETNHSEKVRGKSKSLSRSDRVNNSARVDKLRQTLNKNRSYPNNTQNNHFNPAIPCTDEVINKSKFINDDNNRNKTDVIEATQLRNKPKRSIDSLSRTENFIHDALNGFSYTGSIELKFEEALEVCSDNLYDEIDEELGRNLFDDESDNYILEAYNRPGDELIETYIEVEHKSVSQFETTENIPKPVDLGENTEKEIENKSVFQFMKAESISKSKLNLAENKEKEDLCLVSEDDECVFIEAYNSVGHELRKTYCLVDKNLSRKSLNEIAKDNKSLSISSDVQQYFNEIGEKCEGEDFSLPQTSANTCTNYGGILNGYKNSLQASNVKLNESDSDDVKSESSDEQIYELLRTEDVIKFTPQTKSDFIIHELLETESRYINNLKKILNDYLNYFRKFPSLSQPKISTIFGNIEKIYVHTVEFYQALLLCSNDYEAVALTFVDYKDLFRLYPIYMKNKPRADRVLLSNYKSLIEDRQKKLKDRLDLMSYLLNPIQRLGRYILLMENLQKSVRRSESLDPAIEILKKNMTKGNDAIAVESILGVPSGLDLYRKGSYIDREKFVMTKPRRQETVIFLFEDIVVFTTEVACYRRDVHATFTYNASIEMNDLAITVVDGETQTFQLTDYPKCKKYKDAATYVFEAKDKKTRDHWATLIQGRLWAQLEKFKDQSRSYKSVSRTNSTCSANASKYINEATYHTSESACASRQNSDKSKKTTSHEDKNGSSTISRRTQSASTKPNHTKEERKAEKYEEKPKRTRRFKNDNGKEKRGARFYTDPQNYKTM